MEIQKLAGLMLQEAMSYKTNAVLSPACLFDALRTASKMSDNLADANMKKREEKDRVYSISSLATQLEFHEEWDVPFGQDGTRLMYEEDGTEKDMGFMIHIGGRRFYEGCDGSCTVMVHISSNAVAYTSWPSDSVSLEDYIASGKAWENIIYLANNLESAEQEVGGFYASMLDLCSENTDLTEFVKKHYILDDKIKGSFIQSAHLKAGVYQVDAISKTSILANNEQAPEPCSSRKDIAVDRPSAYAIFDRYNTPLFIGTIYDPKGIKYP